MNAKIDILMPTYKPNAEHLHEAIESVFAQSEQHWTLHIQDEPTDVDTKHLVKKYLEDDRVSFQSNTMRLGIGKNWNACVRHSTAAYIQFMFQDDIWRPNILESGIRVLDTHADVGMVSFGHNYRMEGSNIDGTIYKELEETMRNFSEEKKDGIPLLFNWMRQGLRPNIIGEPCFVMLRRSAVNTAGMFHETMQQQLDCEYWTRMLAVSDWYYLPGNFGEFRVHASATTARNARNNVGLLDRLSILWKAIFLLPMHRRPKAFALFIMHCIKMIQKFISRTCQP